MDPSPAQLAEIPEANISLCAEADKVYAVVLAKTSDLRNRPAPVLPERFVAMSWTLLQRSLTGLPPNESGTTLTPGSPRRSEPGERPPPPPRRCATQRAPAPMTRRRAPLRPAKAAAGLARRRARALPSFPAALRSGTRSMRASTNWHASAWSGFALRWNKAKTTGSFRARAQTRPKLRTRRTQRPNSPRNFSKV